jgi:hypothetical protein
VKFVELWNGLKISVIILHQQSNKINIQVWYFDTQIYFFITTKNDTRINKNKQFYKVGHKYVA